jgi:hypothetical protein
MKYIIFSLLALISTPFITAQEILLYDHNGEALGRARHVSVLGDGSCFFHAVDIPRHVFKSWILNIKNNPALTPHPGLQAYAASLNENSLIFSHQHAEFSSNVLLPADKFTDAEAMAIAFGFRLEIYELSECESRAILSAIYNSTASIIRKLVIKRTLLNLVQEDKAICKFDYVGHYDRLEDGNLGLTKFHLSQERCKQLDDLEHIVWSTHHRLSTENHAVNAAFILKENTKDQVDQYLTNILTAVTNDMNGRTDEYAAWIIHHTTHEINIMKNALVVAYPSVFLEEH